MGKEKNNKINEKEINSFIEKANNQDIKDKLAYIAENVLIEHSNDFQNTWGREAENIGQNINKEHSKKGQEILSSKEGFSNSVKVVATGLLEKNNDFQVNEQFKKDVQNLKISFNDNTKETLRKAFKLIDQMKNVNDEPIVNNDKIDIGGSIFQNTCNIRNKIVDIVKNKQFDKMDELMSYANKFEKNNKELDELISITNNLDSDAFVANSSVARNPELPLKYVEDVKGASRANNLYIISNYIKASGSTIEEYLDNPIEVMNKFATKHSPFNELNKIGQEKGDLEFINSMMDSNSAELKNIKDTALQYAPGLRYLIGSSMMQKENEAENRLAADIYNSHIQSEVRLQTSVLTNSYFKDEALQTVKNILVNTDKQKDYVSLSASKQKFVEPFSGKEIKKFDYNEFVNNGKVDTKELANKFKEISSKINPNSKNRSDKFINASIIEISNDIVNSKKYDNTPEFDSFQKLAGISSMELFEQRRGKTSFKNFIEQEYKAINQDGFKKENVNASLNLAKAISEKYNSRSWLGQRLWGRKEGKLLESMKKDFIDNGFNKDTIDSYLKGNTNKEEIVQENKNAAKPATKRQIHITEADAPFKGEQDISYTKEKTRSLEAEMTKDQL